ncbi:O-antigen ligase family protein, partial [bacterium]|nr:O-antigen ligase family protein [bacterium]
MNKSIKQFVRSDLQYYLFLIVALLIPLTRKNLPIVMVLWGFSGVIYIRKIKIESYKQLILLLFPFLFFISHIIGLIYYDDLKKGLFDLEVKLSILFIPVVAVFITEKVRVNYRLILKFFIFGNFIASIICLILAFSNSISINDLGDTIFEPSYWDATKDLSFFQLVNLRASYFAYSFLSHFHHPTYFSVYIIFSIFILIYLIRSSKKRNLISYGLIVYFSIFIWLLGSRAGYFTYLISFFSFFLIIILQYKKYWIGIGMLIMGVVLTVLVLTNSQINKNITETVNIIEHNESLSKDSDIRLWLWKSGIEVFNDNLLFGVGTGDIDEVMKKKYQKYDLTEAQEHNLNAH